MVTDAVLPAATAATPATAPKRGFDCLAVPALHGWPALQATLVHHIKRAALRHLHASRAGERWLLRLYLAGEEASQQALQREMRADAPDWLARQLEQHLADEQLHAHLFAEAIGSRGQRGQAGVPRPTPQPDWLSRRKLKRWHALMSRYSPHFAAGAFVPAYAIGLAAEQTAARILQRHCDLIGPDNALHPLLFRVLGDEERHTRLCIHTLQCCVAAHEQARLAQLMCEIRTNDRRFGLAGATGMWVVGVALRLRG